MSDDELVIRKRLLRRAVLARRAKASAASRGAAAIGAADRALAVPEIAAAARVMAFASFGSEIPSDPLVERLLAAGVTVLMPYVFEGRLGAAEISSVEDLAPGYRGIREPRPPAPAEAPADADVVIVPGVAFDARGNRLGYGGGFYDRFLAGARGLRVGLCLDLQIVAEVPAGPLDEPVAVVVSEARTIRVGG